MAETQSSRRFFLNGLLAATGATALGPAALAALDAAVSRAAAQPVPGGPVPPLQLVFPNWPDFIEISRLLSRSWGQLGISVSLRQGTLESLLAEVIGEHKVPHAVAISWGGAPDRLDPDYFLSEFFHSRRAVAKGLNYGHYRNAEYDKLADAQRAEMDPDKRREMVLKLQAMLAEQNPAIVMLHRSATQAFNKARFEGVVDVLGSGFAMPYIPWSYLKMKPLTGRKIVRVTNIYDIVTLNPFATPEINNSTTLRWMYPTFVIRGPDTNLQPWAAEKWTVVDPKTIDLVLRDGMTFDDGKPVTVEDVKFTFDYILKWKFPALARVSDSVASVEIKSPREVRINLRQPAAPFVPSVLTFAFIAPKHVWENVPADLKSPADWPNAKPVGYGAFRFKEWRKGEYLHFDVNKSFFTSPNIDGVIWLVVPNIENQLAMMERGEADMIGWTIDAEQAKRLREHKDLTVRTVPSHGLHEARFNMEMAPVSDAKFRLALQHATNRKELVDVVFGGLAEQANNTFIAPASKFWTNPDVANVEFSIDKGRKVLAGAGYTWDGDGKLRYPKT